MLLRKSPTERTLSKTKNAFRKLLSNLEIYGVKLELSCALVHVVRAELSSVGSRITTLNPYITENLRTNDMKTCAKRKTA